MVTNASRRTQDGTITMRTRRLRRNDANESSTDDKDGEDEITEILQGSVAFWPIAPLSAQLSKIAVAFRQTMFASGSCLSMPPNIIISYKRPDDSEPFQLIRKGDLVGLVKSLAMKRSCLSDRDSSGRCLLNVGF